MKSLFIVMALLLTAAGQDKSAPPTYQGLVCMGWAKPEAQAIADGDSEGEALVVNTPLTEKEKRQLYYARQEADAAYRKEQETENLILSHHHLLFPTSHGSDWLREGPCGDTPMIRSGEYHITQFVPSNPKYPGESSFVMAFHHDDPTTCQNYFANMRKRAVKAKYGPEADETYIPKEP
jgi:hypothetical protein